MKNIIILIAVALLFTACVDMKPEGHDHGHGGHDDHGGHDEHADGEIHFTQGQIQTVGIQFGGFSDVKVSDFVTTTGTLGVPPNSFVTVSAKAEGFITGSKVIVEGSKVSKGDVLAYIENPEFITKQQDYLVLKAELSFLKTELIRQQDLVNANAGVEKSLQKMESEVAVKEAQIKGTAKYLQYLGISTSKLTTENIRHKIAITAPISGHITSIKLHNGLFVSQSTALLEIVDESHLHLELDIFENDIAKIFEGQRISYSAPAIGNKIYEGEVYIIGKEFDMTNKTVRVHGHLAGAQPPFIKDLFVNAKVWLSEATTQSVPDAAVITDGKSSFIFVGKEDKEAKDIDFKKVNVIAGASTDGYTAIKLLDEIPEGLRIVVSGAYYIQAQSQAGKMTHEH